MTQTYFERELLALRQARADPSDLAQGEAAGQTINEGVQTTFLST